MAERRSLVEGIKPAMIDRSLEERFVQTGKADLPPPAAAPSVSVAAEPRDGKGRAATTMSRVPLTTRIRADYAAALKRASLERQLHGVVPSTLQDILEEALQPWLHANGYLS